MQKLKEIKDFYRNEFITKYNCYEFEGILSAETIDFLENIGLPKETPIIRARFDDELLEVSDRFIAIGKAFNQDDILIDIQDNESVGFESSSTMSIYISKNIKVMLECFYEYEKFSLEVLENETLGPYYSNKQKYADYLSDKLRSLDEDTLDFNKGYFWGSIIEDLERGI